MDIFNFLNNGYNKYHVILMTYWPTG